MKTDRDWLGALVGLAVFLLGVAGLGFTFFVAFQEFSVRPGQALGIVEGQTIDVSRTANLGYALLSRMLSLIMMCIISSVIANRGIKMYAHRFGLTRVPAVATKAPNDERPEV